MNVPDDSPKLNWLTLPISKTDVPVIWKIILLGSLIFHHTMVVNGREMFKQGKTFNQLSLILKNYLNCQLYKRKGFLLQIFCSWWLRLVGRIH